MSVEVPTFETLTLAVVTGMAFGVFVWEIWRVEWSRFVMGMLLLYFLQTLSQQLLRQFQIEADGGTMSLLEINVVAITRTAFAVAAVGAVWALQRRHRRDV